MVARTWSGMAKRDRIDAYLTHLREKTLPSLGGIAGHRGAFVLQRPSSDGDGDHAVGLGRVDFPFRGV